MVETLGRQTNSVPIAVMQMVDSLALGGAERMAVNLANHLPRQQYRLSVCATRSTGPLVHSLAEDVEFLSLQRRYTLDVIAIRQLIEFLWLRHIRLIHAHGSALFIAVVASLFPPFPRIIWHNHYGEYANQQRASVPYFVLSRRLTGVIAVSQQLADWSSRVLGVSRSKVWYIPNFACLPDNAATPIELPGDPHSRIVCVASLRPEKDHLVLLDAMTLVTREVPKAQLILVGAAMDLNYRDRILKEIIRLKLEHNVSWLGEREDVAAILRVCSIGVLSSVSEGLPLALIEYGLAGLPVVATRVGQCAEVLDDGRAGLLVSSSCPQDLAVALLDLLRTVELRMILGAQLRRRVNTMYSADAVIEQVGRVYSRVLKD